MEKNKVEIKMRSRQYEIETEKYKLKTESKWHIRLWYLLSNPFLYVFTGVIRY